MKIFKLFCLSSAILLLSHVGFSQSMRNSYNSSSPGNKSLIGRELNANGFISCKNQNHSSPEDCDLQFTRLSDWEVFEIVESPELLKMHCKNEAKEESNLEVRLTGNIAMIAAFHDDHLKVTQFEILGDYTGETVSPKSRNNEPSRPLGSRNKM